MLCFAATYGGTENHLRADGDADPAESEIERFSLDQFRQMYYVPESDDAGESTATAAEKLFPESQRPDELWMYVVWILLVLLAMEIFVANRTPA